MRDEPGRDPRLDGVRGLAILLVMLFHTAQWGVVRRPADHALTAVASLGWTGVDLFFVLSGFLITGILLTTRESSTYASAFYARRTLRIFPLYYTVLAFLLLVAPRLPLLSDVEAVWSRGARGEELWHWLYLSNVDVARHGWGHLALTVTWSLAVEEHFYLLWPWIVRRVSEQRLLLVCVAIAAGALVSRAAVFASGAPSLAAYVLTPCRLDTLATGAAIAIAARRPGGLAPLADFARRLLGAAACVFAGVALYARILLQDRPLLRQVSELLTDPLVATLGYSALCALWGSLLVLLLTAAPGARLGRAFELGALRSLGRYSYALYLLHLPVAIALGQVFPPEPFARHFALAQIAYWLAVIGSTYLLARVTWIVLEAPLLRLKRHVPYRV
ncbi:MAG: hypothetical protein DCC71_19325 [Proteobacteria bacterium]|nr:MAG: hypothetical protein DCC71_19325 [Pseudomonadota bacterium]